MNCRHCKQPVKERAGRGLCRACWNKPEVRSKYPPIAGFGSREAAEMANEALTLREAAGESRRGRLARPRLTPMAGDRFRCSECHGYRPRRICTDCGPQAVLVPLVLG